MSEPALLRLDSQWYFGRWAAYDLEDWLLWGPELIPDLAETLRPLPPPETLGFECGGALVCSQSRRLLWFGGQSLDSLALRRLYLQVQRYLWPGWSVDFADRGMRDIADELSLLYGPGGQEGPTPAMGDWEVSLYDQEFQHLAREPEPDFEPRGVGSARLEDGVQIVFPLINESVTQSFLWAGPTRVMRAIQNRRNRAFFTLEEDAPGGFHLDLRNKELLWWETYFGADWTPGAEWEGWKVTDLRSSFEEHEARCEGRIKIKLPEFQELREWFVKNYSAQRDPFNGQKLYDEEGEETDLVGPFPLTRSQRVERLNSALGRLNPGLGVVT